RGRITKPGEWIGGRNYDPNGMAERRWPTRQELDKAAPEHPVLITIRGGHACVANTRALELAGITRDTPNPEGGVIDRDAAGELPGALGAGAWIGSVPPPASLPAVKDGLAAINEMYLKVGITSVHDAGAQPRSESYRAYRDVIADRRMKLRVYLMPYRDYAIANDSELRALAMDDRLRTGAVKMFMDGSIQCFTCAFREPYVTRDTRGWEGLRYTQEQADEAVFEAHRRGYQLAIHAQGDYGITVAVNALERAMRRHPRSDCRHRIEHTLCPTLEDLARMKALGTIPNFFLFDPWFCGV